MYYIENVLYSQFYIEDINVYGLYTIKLYGTNYYLYFMYSSKNLRSAHDKYGFSLWSGMWKTPVLPSVVIYNVEFQCFSAHQDLTWRLGGEGPSDQSG